MSARGFGSAIYASRGTDGVRSAVMGSLHLTAGVASVIAAQPALAQPAGTVDIGTVDVQGGSGSGAGEGGGGVGGAIGLAANGNDYENSYVVETSGISRIPVRLIDLPQQVNVVTEQVMRQEGVTTLEQALRNVSGITFSAGEGGTQGDNPILRGFSARGDIYRDGIRDPGWYTRDMFNIDAVEVFMGPSGFAFGRGSTGGAINLVSKLPVNRTFTEIDVTGYSSPGWRATLDANGKVNENITARITAMGQDVDVADRNNVSNERWGFNPSVTFNWNDKTKVTASYFFQYEDSVPDYGVPYLPTPTLNTTPGLNFGKPTGGYYGNGRAVTPVPVPRDTWYGVTTGPFADTLETTTNMATLQLEHELNEYVTITNGTRYTSNDRFIITTAPRTLGTWTGNTSANALIGYPVPLMTIGQQRFQTQTDSTQLTNLTDMVAKFEWGGFKHTLNAGIELTRETRDQQRFNLCNQANGACRTSLYVPNNTGLGVGGYANYLPSTTNSTEMTDVAFYMGDQIKLNEYFEVMGTARWDISSTDYSALTYSNTVANPPAVYSQLSNDDDMFNYRVGAVYHPWKNTSVYVAYGTSANPSSEYGVLANDTVTLSPETNNTLEGGIKSEVLDGKFVLTASVFRTEKTNTRVPTDPAAGLPPTVLGGQQLVQGFSLGGAGKLTDKWDLTVSYTYLDSEIQSVGTSPTLASLATVGKELPNTPPNSLSIWTTYKVTDQLTVGGGATYNDATFANANNTVYVPSFITYDAMASYQFNKNFALQLNVYNLTDEYYYAQYYGGHAVPAAGRYATLTARSTF